MASCQVCDCEAFVKTPGIAGICGGKNSKGQACKHGRNAHSATLTTAPGKKKVAKGAALGCDRCKCKHFVKTPGLPRVCLTCSHDAANHRLELDRGFHLQGQPVAASAGASGSYNNCDICQQPITEKNGPEVKAGEFFYHKDCFLCEICHQHLTEADNINLMGTYYCAKHFKVTFSCKDADKDAWQKDGANKAQVTESNYCPKCGYDNPPTVRACQRCGKEQKSSAEVKKEVEVEEWKPTLKGLTYAEAKNAQAAFRALKKDAVDLEAFNKIVSDSKLLEKHKDVEPKAKKCFDAMDHNNKGKITEPELLAALSDLVLEVTALTADKNSGGESGIWHEKLSILMFEGATGFRSGENWQEFDRMSFDALWVVNRTRHKLCIPRKRVRENA
eukprot:g38589.t1